MAFGGKNSAFPSQILENRGESRLFTERKDNSPLLIRVIESLYYSQLIMKSKSKMRGYQMFFRVFFRHKRPVLTMLKKVLKLPLRYW